MLKLAKSIIIPHLRVPDVMDQQTDTGTEDTQDALHSEGKPIARRGTTRRRSLQRMLFAAAPARDAATSKWHSKTILHTSPIPDAQPSARCPLWGDDSSLGSQL